MQRKRSKTTRAANSEERQFMAYTKTCACIVCGKPGPSIVDHCLGSTFKHLKQLCGPWFIIPLCERCDSFKSVPHGNIPRFVEMAGKRLYELWEKHIVKSPFKAPPEVHIAIVDWGR